MSDLWVGLTEGEDDQAADGRVTELGRHQAARDFPASEQLLALWTSLAIQRGDVPSRHQIDPLSLGAALSVTFLLESVAPGVARFRVAGSRICDLMGMEVRGMPLISLFTPKSRDEISQVLQVVLGRLAQARLVLGGESGFGRPPLEARMLLLPLLDDMGRATRAIGALEFRGQVGRTPRRLEIREQRLALLRTGALTQRPGRAASAPGNAPAEVAAGAPGDSTLPQPAAAAGPWSGAPAGFAETQRGFAPRRSKPQPSAAGASGSELPGDKAQPPGAGVPAEAQIQAGSAAPYAPQARDGAGSSQSVSRPGTAQADDLPQLPDQRQALPADGAAGPETAGQSGNQAGPAGSGPDAGTGAGTERPAGNRPAMRAAPAMPPSAAADRPGSEAADSPGRADASGSRTGRLPPDIPPDLSASPAATPPARARPWLRVIQGGKV